MIVDQPDGLHGGIKRHRTYETKPQVLQPVAEGLASRGPGGYLVAALGRGQRRGGGVFSEDVRQTPARDVQGDQGLGVRDGRPDLHLVADDPGVRHQAGDVLLTETRHRFRVETREGHPERLAFAQDHDPVQPRLETLQYVKNGPRG